MRASLLALAMLPAEPPKSVTLVTRPPSPEEAIGHSKAHPREDSQRCSDPLS